MSLDAIEDSMSETDMARLIELRGGCSCHISPPCSAHSSPLTEDEAEELGLTEPQSKTDCMQAVRDLCKGNTR